MLLMSINWPVVVGVFTSGGLLGGGVLVAIVEGIFRNPEKRANIAVTYTDAGVKLMEQWQAANAALQESNKSLRTSNEKLQTSNERLDGSLRETREVLILLVEAVERVVPILREVADSNERRRWLWCARPSTATASRGSAYQRLRSQSSDTANAVAASKTTPKTPPAKRQPA
jgi:hypothetical protein